MEAWLAEKLYDLCGGIVVIFVFFIAMIALQIIECILDIIIAPRFGMSINSASVFGFIFIRDNHQWKMGFHHLSPFCQCRKGYDLNKPIPEDSSEREKHAAYLIRALAVLISWLMVFLLWRGNESSGVSYGKWELLWNPHMLGKYFVTGMIIFSAVNMVRCIYVFQLSMKRLAGYIDGALKKLRQGYSFEELNLKPIEELAFEKVTEPERLLYYYVYVYYLLAVGRTEEMDKVSQEITQILENSVYELNYTGLYYWLVYYYSKYNIDARRADQFLEKAGPVLSKDSDANAKRVLAQYYYRIQGNMEKAREYLQEGLACVENYSTGAERELEKRLLEELEQELNKDWQWCLVGNIIGEHEYGENHELRYGNKQFRPNAKVFINLIYGGMGHENILVIGIPRHSCKYIEIVIARKYVENFRLQKVFKPAVLKKMEQSQWDWWGNTDSARDRIIGFLEWLNPVEAEKAKGRL